MKPTPSRPPSHPLAELAFLAGGTWRSRSETPSGILETLETCHFVLGGSFLRVEIEQHLERRLVARAEGYFGCEGERLRSWTFIDSGESLESVLTGQGSDPPSWTFSMLRPDDGSKTQLSHPEANTLLVRRELADGSIAEAVFRRRIAP